MAKKKPKREINLKCFISCEHATLDPNGKQTLYALFDSIFVDKFPGLFRPFCLFAKLTGGSGKAKLSLDAFGPNGKVIFRHKPIDIILNPKEGNDITMQIGTMPLERHGRVRFVLNINSKAVGWPCEIRVRPTKEKK